MIVLKKSSHFLITRHGASNQFVTKKAISASGEKELKNDYKFYALNDCKWLNKFDIVSLKENEFTTKFVDGKNIYSQYESLKSDDKLFIKISKSIAEYNIKLEIGGDLSFRIINFFQNFRYVLLLIKARKISLSLSAMFIKFTFKEMFAKKRYSSNNDMSYSNILYKDGEIYFYDFANLSIHPIGYDLFFLLNHVPQDIESWRNEYSMIETYLKQFGDYSVNNLKTAYVISGLRQLYVKINHPIFKADLKSHELIKNNLKKFSLIENFLAKRNLS